ncbi:VWA domain-containing protein [Thermomonospora catenispora]|uniref:VWA domain-containing protein n=1 Tax=Thermomonospora catenispora TaxID=2493090 RepID=UPI0011222D88|nr:VWA domain-containing protein [Thermomonospora catenispora]TNY35522.1 VWA domain-containing protein [Thermomonospora catenispora]
MSDRDDVRRQVLLWRLLGKVFDAEEQPALEAASLAVVRERGLPEALLDPRVSVDTVVQRFPELEPEFADPMAGGDDGDRVRRTALVTKLLLNAFCTGSGAVSAQRLSAWQRDAGWLRRALGACAGGGAGQGNGAAGADAGPGRDEGADGGGRGRGRGAGQGFTVTDADLQTVLAGLEADLVRRMRLREVLADPALAARLTPSMSLVEQLLRDKHNLSGTALANAKALIRRFVNEVAEVLRTRVEKAAVGAIDRDVPPKRVFRNLDLDRTVWKNLINYDPQEERLYVDRLFFKRTARRTAPARMIVVVDQSGSMVDAMVNCTILASIFAGLPKVDVHLIAYDTRAVDLTPWVSDPFEVLLRTRLGGGTYGPVAMQMARPKITDPRNTALVWISDFYDDRGLLDDFAALHESGVKFIPVGSVDSAGHASVDPWYRQKLKELGTPVLSGRIDRLVAELKSFLA